jgi:hypothetical protein
MKLNFSNLLLIIIVLGVTSCDKVEDPYKYVAPPADCPEPTFGTGHTGRNVLLEEFTGNRCPNCPGAAAYAINTLAPLHGDRLILASLHEGNLAEPIGGNYSVDYTTDAGYDYFNWSFFSIPYVPVAAINRTSYGGGVALDKSDWAAAIDVAKAKPLEIDLQLITEYNETQNKACLFLQTEFKANMSGAFNLVIYVLEDSIVSWQINSATTGDPFYESPEDSNYVHRHMLRDNVNGTWGTEVFNGSAITGQKILTSFNYNPDPAWNPEHLIFVAYIYDAASNEIHQVVEKHLIE